jgi:hypothetical protein
MIEKPQEDLFLNMLIKYFIIYLEENKILL